MNEGRSFTFTKNERVSGEKRIDALFANGQSFIAYPLRIVFYVYDGTNKPSISVLISIPKKKIKSAVKRNRMKRLIREAYRLNKHKFNISRLREGIHLDIAFIYLKEELTGYAIIEKSVCKAIGELSDQLITQGEK